MKLASSPLLPPPDEATSSLDAETTAAINATFQNFARRCIIIMITHDLSAVDADTIFVLSEGRLVEQGTHSDLLAHSELYQ